MPILEIVAPEVAQLAIATGDLYTCPADLWAVVKITLVNTDSAARLVNLFRLNSGGTATRIIDKDYSLGAGREVTVGPVFLEGAGKIRGNADAANVVDVTLSVLTRT
jgi:hypothetical protein